MNVLLIKLCYVITCFIVRNMSLIMRRHEALSDINRHLKEKIQEIMQEVCT